MIKIFFYTLIILNLSFVHATTLLTYRKLKGQEILPESLSRSINKSALKILAGQKDYELVLNSMSFPESTTVNIHAIEGQINKKDDLFSINLQLINIKNKKVLRDVSIENIMEADLVRIIQGGLEALFQNLPGKQNTTSRMSNPTTLSSQIATSVNMSTPPTPPPTIAFRDMILKLQKLADQSVLQEANKRNSLAEDTNEEGNQNFSNASKFSISAISAKETAPEIEPDDSSRMKRNYNIKGNYERRIISSDYLVKTFSNVNIFSFEISGDIYHFQGKKLKFHYVINYAKPLQTTVEDKPITSPNLLNLGLTSSLNTQYAKFNLGLIQEDLLFYNIEEIGEGLKSSVLTSKWLSFSFTKLAGRYGKHPVFLEGRFSHLIGASSEWQELSNYQNFIGSRVGIGVKVPKTFSSFDSDLSVDYSSLSSDNQRFRLTDTRFILGTSYTF